MPTWDHHGEKYDRPNYSQAGEEEAILRVFGDKADGRLLDIGAWNPRTFSNSRALIERGWSAVLIEPSPTPLRDLITEYKDHPRVEVIGAAVGCVRDWCQMQMTDDALSTSVSGVHAIWKERGGYYGTMTVLTIGMAELMNRYGGAWDFVSIDAEGTSVDLLFALLDTGCNPKCICCEHDGRLVEIGKRAAEHGYRFELTNDTNVVVALR